MEFPAYFYDAPVCRVSELAFIIALKGVILSAVNSCSYSLKTVPNITRCFITPAFRSKNAASFRRLKATYSKTRAVKHMYK